MSAFDGGGFAGGSGFGSPNPGNNSNNPFGGGGFRSTTENTTNGGFGKSSGTVATPPFGSGFGAQNSNNPNHSFGSSPAITPFGGSTDPSSFQNVTTAGGMSFGSSPNVMFSNSGGANGRSFGEGSGHVGFGGTGKTFGSQHQSHSQQQQQQSSSSSSTFGGAHSQSHQSSSPFGGVAPQPQQTPMTFGSSSNVVINQERKSVFGGGEGNNAGASFGGNNTTSTFGTFGSNVTSDERISGNESGTSSFNKNPATSSGNKNPFGGDNNISTFSAQSNTFTNPKIDNANDTMTDSNAGNHVARKNIDMEKKRRKLMADIEEKKRQLFKKQQQKKRQEEAGRRSKSPTSMSASTKVPLASHQGDLQSKSLPPQQSLAERNALRFAKHRSQPSIRTKSPVPTTNTNASTEREDLKHAVNLVGLCTTMCPSDELERRRNESDIQALEVPLPGRMHPSNWTLKDTAIKRFRRSAADYKLDVPEWVRPPEVLERTLGYLEEWIMERDRQGPDPRFPQKDVAPPPLDVYQFIWDRTRMIRKDFILQNYVGTGGRCDAKAVRCHERIARWHAMCEHQLSHIDDFVNMQSQQNMQELGQTMKTLNSFYDDALSRSTKEKPDEKNGRETFVPDTNHTANANSDKNKSARGGCVFDTVQGQNPEDYNGCPLNNVPDNPMIAYRLIGDNNNKTLARGTAEPEMRGIYMLLTMENEGGMEVLKYAEKLFKERPTVYRSPPVQLALTIFKAIKDLNYVKFFSILRSKSTPYLFSCIMFKQVEVMRRTALQIMSRAYGARSKNGEALYDQYPLERLMHILCFEDMEEAKQTCEFYNVTVREHTSKRTGEINEYIMWKGSTFRVPKDTEKGHTLRLQPRKMIRTIESKLNGATRLAICRGEVSGKGAALFGESENEAVPKPSDNLNLGNKKQGLLEKTKREISRLNEQAKEAEERRVAESRRMLEEKQREEQRRKELKEQQRLAEFEKRRREKLKEDEIRRQRIEEESKRRKEEDLVRKRMAEKAQKDAEEAARKQKSFEEQRKREERKKQKLELERKIALEKQRKETAEAERRRREEEEARRREALRLELEAKEKREAEERRKANEWQSRIDAATKVIMWYRWKRVISRPLEILFRSKKSLREIDPSYSADTFNLVDTAQRITFDNRPQAQVPLNQQKTSQDIIEKMITVKCVEEAPKLAVGEMVLHEIESLSTNFLGSIRSRKSVILLKIALICPETLDITDQCYSSLVYRWIATRVNLGETEVAKSSKNTTFPSKHEVRVLVVRGSSSEVCSSCDIALFVIPPQWSKPGKKSAILNRFASSLLDEDIPRVVLVLNDIFDQDHSQTINNTIAKELGGNMEAISIIQPSELSVAAFDSALKTAFHRIAKLFTTKGCMSVIRIPVMQLATKVIRSVLWQCIPSVTGDDIDEDTIVEFSRLSLRVLMDELSAQLRRHKVEWSLWPAPEFSSNEGVVESYFTDSEGLPLQWTRCLSQDFLLETFHPLLFALRGHFRDVYQRIVIDAPIIVQDDCASECAQGQYRRCLEKALMWVQDDSASNGCFLYFPGGVLQIVMKDVVAKVEANLSPRPATFGENDPNSAVQDDSPRNSISSKKIGNTKTSQDHRNSLSDSLNAGTAPTTTFHGNDSFLSSNKRSRSTGQIENMLKKKRREDDTASRTAATSLAVVKKTTNENIANVSNFNRPNDTQRKKMARASQSYTKKLERLLRGDETIEMSVGNTVLSRYLRDVPGPEVEQKLAL